MRNRIVALALTISLMAGCAFRTTPEDSLYERLGAETGVAAVIDSFSANCVADPRINRYFLAVGANPERLATFKRHLADQICQAAGGPCEYEGRDMKTVHQGMGISDQDFNALVENLVKALDKAEVMKGDQEILLGILGPMRKEIVEKRS